MRIEHNGGNEYFFKDVKIKSFLLITNILDIKRWKNKNENWKSFFISCLALKNKITREVISSLCDYCI